MRYSEFLFGFISAKLFLEGFSGPDGFAYSSA